MDSETIKRNRSSLRRIFEKDLAQISYYSWSLMKRMGYHASKDDLGDLVHDTYVKAYYLLSDPRYENILNFQGWVRRILQFETLNFLRKVRKVKIDISEIEGFSEFLDFITYSMNENIEAKNAFQVLLETLSIEKKAILEMTIKGYTTKDIAKELRKSHDAVRQEKRRLIADLRSRLKNFF